MDNQIFGFLADNIFTTTGALWVFVLIIGYIVIAVRQGFKTGNWYTAAVEAARKILADGSTVETFLEKHIADWPQERKDLFLTISDVFSPLTKTTVTDIDDEVLREIRQLFQAIDGSDVPGDGEGNTPLG